MFPYCIYGTLTDSFQADVFLLKLRMGDMEKTAAETISWWRCKKVKDKLEALVLTWITEQRRKCGRVSRKMLRTKAKRIFDKEIDRSQS